MAVDATATFLTMKKGNHFPFLKKKTAFIKVEKETFEYTCQQVRTVFVKNTIVIIMETLFVFLNVQL